MTTRSDSASQGKLRLTSQTRAKASGFRHFMRMVAMVAMVACLLCCPGCGDGLHRVTSVVLVDGKPAAEGVQVRFLPKGNTWMASGMVGSDGLCVMSTRDKRGVMSGEYVVTVVNSTRSIPRPDTVVDTASGKPPADVFKYMGEVQKLLDNPPVGPEWIPKSYADMAKSPLRINVPKDGSNVKFEVPSNTGDDKGAKRAGGAAK
jgi:hypothetical protein